MRIRPLDPEMREGGKFFPRRLSGIDGEPTRREPVHEILRDTAEVARPLKHQKLVPRLLRVDLGDETKARERQRDLGELRSRGSHVEHFRGGDEIVRHAVLDRRDGHRRRLQIEIRPQQLDAERQSLLAPDCRVAIEVNAAVLLRAQLVQARRQGAALRGVRFCREPLRLRKERVVAEGIPAGSLGRRRLCGLWMFGMRTRGDGGGARSRRQNRREHPFSDCNRQGSFSSKLTNAQAAPARNGPRRPDAAGSLI